MDRPIKITFADMRAAGVRGILVSDRWSDDLRLSDIEPQFVCKACGSTAPTSDHTSAGAISRLA